MSFHSVDYVQGLLFWMLYALLQLFQKLERLQPSNSLSARACKRLFIMSSYLFIYLEIKPDFSFFGEDIMYSFCVNNHVFLCEFGCEAKCVRGCSKY